MRIWLLRCGFLTLFAVVIWWFGPRAYTVLAARVGGGSGVEPVDLDRVGPGPAPAWLREDPVLYRAVLEEISPVLETRVRADDGAALTALATRLRTLSWVEAVRVGPGEKGGLRLRMQLARPVLEVVPDGPAVGQVDPVFVTATGRCLRHGRFDQRSELPRCVMRSGWIPDSLPRFILGQVHPDPRVQAAAAVAEEWREEMLARVPDAPALIEIDTSNLNYRLLAHRGTSQVRIDLCRDDGGVTRLDYGLPPGQPLPRVSIADKASVLGRLLQRYPGLKGIAQADLRFANLWEQWVRPDPGPAESASGDPGR